MKSYKNNKKKRGKCGEESVLLNIQPLYIQVCAENLLPCFSLTIEIQVNVQWKRPAWAAPACPENSLYISTATSPSTPA